MTHSPAELCHDRIRNYVLTEDDVGYFIDDPTFESLTLAYDERAKKNEKRKSKWTKDFFVAYNCFYPPYRKWEIRYIDEIYEIGIVATEDIKKNETIAGLKPIYVGSVKESEREKKQKHDSSMIRREKKIGNGRRAFITERLRGPVAFLNHACAEHGHMNICSTGNWDSWFATKNIKAGEQLLTDYYGWCDEEENIPEEGDLSCLKCEVKKWFE
jgi:hypothetical protein